MLPIHLRATVRHIASEMLLLSDLVPARFYTFTVPAALYDAREQVAKRIKALYASYEERYDEMVAEAAIAELEAMKAQRVERAQNLLRGRKLREKVEQGDFDFAML